MYCALFIWTSNTFCVCVCVLNIHVLCTFYVYFKDSIMNISFVDEEIKHSMCTSKHHFDTLYVTVTQSHSALFNHFLRIVNLIWLVPWVFLSKIMILSVELFVSLNNCMIKTVSLKILVIQLRTILIPLNCSICLKDLYERFNDNWHKTECKHLKPEIQATLINLHGHDFSHLDSWIISSHILSDIFCNKIGSFVQLCRCQEHSVS